MNADTLEVGSLLGRYYDPSTDQFLSVDPDVGATGQPYSYTGDDPVNGSDPLGNMATNQYGQGCGPVISDCNETPAKENAGNYYDAAPTGPSSAPYASIPTGTSSPPKSNSSCSWLPIGCGTISDVVGDATAAYVGGCIGTGSDTGFGAEVCVETTSYGGLYLTPAVGPSTPGTYATVFGGHINGTKNPGICQTNTFLKGPSLTGGAAYGPYAGAVWGNEGQFGKSDWGYQAGAGSPGASVMQGYGFELLGPSC
jgi:hypothetical protein